LIFIVKSNEDAFLRQQFCSKTTISILAITVINGQFVKFRLTSPFYPELNEAIQSTVGEFRHLTMLVCSP